MKIFISFLTAIFISPSIALADASDFEEVDYVFRSYVSENAPPIDDCYDIGAIFPSTLASNFDLYSLQSKKTNGIVLKDNIKKIGHVLTCVDASELTPGGNPFILFPARFKVTLDGMELIVEGQGQFRSFDIPEFPLGMATFSLRIVEGPPEVIGGWLVTNTIANVFGAPGYIDGSFATIRLFTPAVKKGSKK